MKKFNKKIIVLAIAIIIFVGATIITYAAFSYRKNVVSTDVTIGDVEIDKKSFISYSKKTTEAFEDSSEYYRLCKLRTDSIAYVEGITISTNYQEVSITSFQSGQTYYTKVDNEYVAQSTYSSGEEYYVRVDSLSVKTAYDSTNKLLSASVSNNIISLNDNSDNLIERLTLTIENNLIKSVVLNDPVNHRYVIGSDGLSIYIFTKEVGTYKTVSEEDSIICYASERKKNDSRIDYDAPYLNQLGMVFEFTTKIPVYVRIHIQDAWISTQFLSSKSERVRYVSKDKISGSSPFSLTDENWYYDASTNIAYYKGMFTPTKNSDGTYASQEYIFNVNEGYFYHDTSSQAASKVTTVQVSFTVDIVQANRAEALWGVDFDELFGN